MHLKSAISPPVDRAIDTGLGKISIVLKEDTMKAGDPDFIEWFDGSKVIDDDCKPLVVYHGTCKRFEVFRAGEEGIFFATSPNTAEFYAGENGYVVPVHLSIQNPLRMSWREWLRGVTDSGINHCLERNNGLAKQGYDGIVLTEPDISDQAMSSVTYVAFSHKQIRSAFGSNLRFLLNNRVEVATEGRHVGPIVEFQSGFAIQSVGRGKLLAHDLSMLLNSPSIGVSLDIHYSDGLPKIVKNKDRDLDVSLSFVR